VIETLYLVKSHPESLAISSKYIEIIGFTSIQFSKDDKTQITKIANDCGLNNLVIVMNSDCRDIDKKLLVNGKDISTPFFDKYNGVKDLVESLKGGQGKEKDLNFYCYTIKQNAFDSPVFTLTDLFTEAKKKEQTKALIEELKNTQRNYRLTRFYV